MRWVEPSWDKEFEEFQEMERAGVVRNAVTAFNRARRCGRMTTLSCIDPAWSTMQNTASNVDLTISQAWATAMQNDKNFGSIVSAIENGRTLPVPIIMVRDDGRLHKVAGNHRLMACRALGIDPTVWLFTQSDKTDVPPSLLHVIIVMLIKESLQSKIVPTLDGCSIKLKLDRPTHDRSAYAGVQTAEVLDDSDYHVTLVKSSAVRPFVAPLREIWDDVVAALPSAPVPVFDEHVHLAERDGGRKKTWFLAIKNQREFDAYVSVLCNEVISTFEREQIDVGDIDLFEFVTAHERFFHVTVANNRGGDPKKSIGDISEDDLDD